MLGGYLEFFMSSAIAEMFQTLRRELDELIQTKVSEKASTYKCFGLSVSILYFVSIALFIVSVLNSMCSFHCAFT